MRGIRCYDNGGPDKPGGSVDRYTVCYPAWYFAGDGAGRSYIYPYVSMSSWPFFPNGICQHGESTHAVDRSSYKHLGKRINFSQLPEDCQKVVKHDMEVR